MLNKGLSPNSAGTSSRGYADTLSRTLAYFDYAHGTQCWLVQQTESDMRQCYGVIRVSGLTWIGGEKDTDYVDLSSESHD